MRNQRPAFLGQTWYNTSYSPLLGGCYVYDGCVNLLHTQVGVNCGYIRCELWLYQVRTVAISNQLLGQKLHIKSQDVQHDQCL